VFGCAACQAGTLRDPAQGMPGHLFLADEADDLASFAQVVMTNGWGGYILPEADRVNAYFSHDEYIEFFAAFTRDEGGVRVLGSSRSARAF
jgi:hypothetical protein